MKLSTGVRLMQVLPSRKESALTVEAIERKWRETGSDPVSRRSIERYVHDLSKDTVGSPALLETTIVGRARAYYLRASQVANWFMTVEAALDLQFSHQVYGRAFGARAGANGDKLVDMAERVTAASPETKRIRDRLRIVPDGIGRQPARIDPLVLKTAIDAIGQGKQLRFDLRKGFDKMTTHLVSPLGLVAKDGAIYLVAVKGLSDSPRHFALQRMSNLDIHFQAAQPRPEFDLDRYILESHQFSHLLDADAPPLKLKLRVAPETMYHFLERPLSSDQKHSPPKGGDPWHTVTATVPLTILLVPFLLGMGHWIEVVEPAIVRAETAKRVRAMWAHYAADTAPE